MIALDTHTFLWWMNNDQHRLSPAARDAIAGEIDGRICVSSISIWEIALLVRQRRISIEIGLPAWLSQVTIPPGLTFIPVDNEIAMASVNLPGNFHRDPADRIVVATARLLDTPLVTIDTKIRAYPHVQTIW